MLQFIAEQYLNDTQGPVVNLSEGWFKVFYSACLFIWGIGLLIHMIASITQKGYEELDV